LRKDQFKDNGRLGPFVPLLKETLDTPAWRALSHGARSLYTSLKRRYNHKNHNNGHLYVSQRDAMKELGSGFEEITNWFRELQYYRFIVMMNAGCLGVDGKGKAPHWRLTELGYMHDAPTRDFAKWDGVKYKRQRRRNSRDQKQNPATENHSGVLRKGVAPLLRKGVAPAAPTATERLSIYEDPPATERRSILS